MKDTPMPNASPMLPNFEPGAEKELPGRQPPSKRGPLTGSTKRSETAAARDPMRHGLYSRTFTADEMRRLDQVETGIEDEMTMLRVKILRLARLIPLKKINDKELEALIKLVRVVVALDALERTDVMRTKVEGAGNALFEAAAELGTDEL
jgi:hypothetical protein